MQKLIKKIKSLEKSSINKEVLSRLKDFDSFEHKESKLWYEELCFCILAANAKGRNAFNIQLDLGAKGFLTKSKSELAKTILRHKHRFHNNKSNYIIESRKYSNIKPEIIKRLKDEGIDETRLWLADNIKGIGMKEASHFLRNTGVKNIAILDRHILNIMSENGIIEKPKNLTTKKYVDIEEKFKSISNKLNMSPAKLDLFMWYMKTGEVMK